MKNTTRTLNKLRSEERQIRNNLRKVQKLVQGEITELDEENPTPEEHQYTEVLPGLKLW